MAWFQPLIYLQLLWATTGLAYHTVEELSGLFVKSSAPYMKRRNDIELECSLKNDDSDVLSNIAWFRDGLPVSQSNSIELTGSTLTIFGNKISDQEGMYQCAANLTLKPDSHSLRIVSSHLSLKKAFIERFPRPSSSMNFGVVRNRRISVVQGQVAYIPCVGLPQSVPGPPNIWFERERELPDGGGRQIKEIWPESKDRFLVTDTGVQIGVVQPSDAGRYRCVAQNPWTNQTRHNRWLLLKVNPSPAENQLSGPVTITAGNLLFPRQKETRLKLAIGQSVWLECISAGGRILWNKINTTKQYASNDDRVRQVWGNLRIERAQVNDSGSYICRVLPPVAKDDEFFATDATILTDNRIPFAIYHVTVYAPPSPKLVIETTEEDGLKVQCKTDHGRPPSLFMNGDRFLDIVGHTRFDVQKFEANQNPITLELGPEPTFTGTVQCMTLSLLYEEDLYGPELMFGKSDSVMITHKETITTTMTSSVINSVPPSVLFPLVSISIAPENSTRFVGQQAILMCVTDSFSVNWLKDGNDLLLGGRYTIVGSGSLNIDNIQESDEGWYTCVAVGMDGTNATAKAYLQVEVTSDLSEIGSDWNPYSTAVPTFDTKPIPKMKAPKISPMGTSVLVEWSLPEGVKMSDVELYKVQFKRKGGQWVTLDEDIDSTMTSKHVNDLLPGESYKFRIGTIFIDERDSSSENTAYIKIADIPTIAPPTFTPEILSAQALSADAIEVKWRFSIDEEAPIDGFIIQYNVPYGGKVKLEKLFNVTVEGSETREHVLDSLLPATPYKIRMSVYNSAGNSAPSEYITARTEIRGFDSSLVPSTTMESLITTTSGALDRPTALFNWSTRTLLIAMGSALGLLVLLIVICLICCTWRQRKQNKVTLASRGKFFDASRRIFKEQTIEKGKLSLYHETLTQMDQNQQGPSTLDDDQPYELDLSDNNYRPTTNMSSFGPTGPTINLYSNPMEGNHHSFGSGPEDDLNVTHGIVPLYGSTGHPFYADEDVEVMMEDNQGSTPECDMPNGCEPFDLDPHIGPAATSSPTRGYLSPYHQALAAASLVPDSGDISGLNSSATTASAASSRRSPNDAVKSQSPLLHPSDYDSTAWSRSGQSSLSRNGETVGIEQPKFYTFKPGSSTPSAGSAVGTLERIYNSKTKQQDLNSSNES